MTLVALYGCPSSSERSSSAGSATPSPTPRPSMPLVVAVIGDPVTFNPIVADSRSVRALGDAVFDTLVRLDSVTAQPRPNLASEWEYDADGAAYVVRLRDDVPW